MDVTRIAQDVLELLRQSTENGLSEDFNKAERQIRLKVQEVGAKALELHLAGQKLGYEGSSRPCPCGRNQKFVEYRPRTLATMLGSVNYERAYYHCRKCGRSSCPYDQKVGLGNAQVSVEMAKAATLVAVHDPFAPAAAILQRLTDQRLSDRTINRLVRRSGKVAAEQERKLALQMATWSVPLAMVCPKRLYVAVDGTTLHLQDGWREVKCVTCYWEDEAGNRHGRYTARLENAEAFRGFVWALACQYGLETAAEVVLLGDGAAWIWEQIAPILGESTICITDGYHVTEHLWDCGKRLFGEGSEAAEAWVERYQSLLWKGKVATVLADLEQQKRQRRGGQRDAVAGLIIYLSNQGQRLAYDRFRRMGLDIGSGRVEAMCKQVGVRMKRAGMCWSDEGAQAALSLRSVWLNGKWDAFWSQQPLAT
jgi:hypothetical protein